MASEFGNSQAVEDYAKAIYTLAHPGEGGEEGVTTGALAEQLGLTPGSVSAMMRKLVALGLARHEPYRGVRLTERGERLALEVLRHHRLLESYLNEELGVPWDRVHEEAELLEHFLSEDLEERIAAKLGHPEQDPHGDPIPTREGEVSEGDTRALSNLEPGEHGLLRRVSDSDPEMLRYLAARGIAPGMRLEVLGREPFGGPLRVMVAGREHMLGYELARAMHVAAASADEKDAR